MGRGGGVKALLPVYIHLVLESLAGDFICVIRWNYKNFL